MDLFDFWFNGTKKKRTFIIDGRDKTKEYYFPVFSFNCCSGFNDQGI